MNIFRSVHLAGWALGAALRRVASLSLWMPFLLIGVLQGLLLVGLLTFHRPWSAPWAMPYLEWLAGPEAFHYPNLFQVLPVAHARLELLLGVLVVSIISGAATLLFARAYGRSTDPPWGAALGKAVHLVLFTLVFSVVLFGLFRLQQVVPREEFLTDRTLRWGVRLGLLLAAILVQTMFVTGTAWIVLRGRNVVTALGDSFRFGAANFLPLFLLVGLPAVLKYPVSWLTSRGDLLIEKFQPETMAGLLGAEIVLEIVFGYLVIGAITAYFLWRTEEAA